MKTAAWFQCSQYSRTSLHLRNQSHSFNVAAKQWCSRLGFSLDAAALYTFLVSAGSVSWVAMRQKYYMSSVGNPATLHAPHRLHTELHVPAYCSTLGLFSEACQTGMMMLKIMIINTNKILPSREATKAQQMGFVSVCISYEGFMIMVIISATGNEQQ